MHSGRLRLIKEELGTCLEHTGVSIVQSDGDTARVLAEGRNSLSSTRAVSVNPENKHMLVDVFLSLTATEFLHGYHEDHCQY